MRVVLTHFLQIHRIQPHINHERHTAVIQSTKQSGRYANITTSVLRPNGQPQDQIWTLRGLG